MVLSQRAQNSVPEGGDFSDFWPFSFQAQDNPPMTSVQIGGKMDTPTRLSVPLDVSRSTATWTYTGTLARARAREPLQKAIGLVCSQVSTPEDCDIARRFPCPKPGVLNWWPQSLWKPVKLSPRARCMENPEFLRIRFPILDLQNPSEISSAEADRGDREQGLGGRNFPVWEEPLGRLLVHFAGRKKACKSRPPTRARIPPVPAPNGHHLPPETGSPRTTSSSPAGCGSRREGHGVVWGWPFCRNLVVCPWLEFSRKFTFSGLEEISPMGITTSCPVSQKPEFGHLRDDAWPSPFQA